MTGRMRAATALRCLCMLLLLALVALVLQRAYAITQAFEFAVDFEIPLRAARRSETMQR